MCNVLTILFKKNNFCLITAAAKPQLSFMMITYPLSVL